MTYVPLKVQHLLITSGRFQLVFERPGKMRGRLEQVARPRPKHRIETVGRNTHFLYGFSISSDFFLNLDVK